LTVAQGDPSQYDLELRLKPSNPRAAPISGYLDPPDTLHLGVGVAGWVETWFGKAGVEAFIQGAEELIRSVVGGGLKEIYWLPRGGTENEVMQSKTYIRLEGRDHRMGAMGVGPTPRADRIERSYEPY
jgi:hypothetical protein